jgi:hypothetical protein
VNGPIDPRMLEALRRDREAPVDDEVRTRVASRLGFAGSAPSAARRDAPVAASGARWRVPAVATLAFVTGAAVGATLYARFVPVPPPRIVIERVPASPIGPPAPSAGAAPPAPGPTADVARFTPSVSSSASVARARTAQLDAERALLDAARSALVGGDSDGALQLLERHAKAFPRPLLGEERDALFVQALVRAGRFDEARGRADAFRRSAPESLLRSAVESAIASIPQ